MISISAYSYENAGKFWNLVCPDKVVDLLPVLYYIFPGSIFLEQNIQRSVEG